MSLYIFAGPTLSATEGREVLEAEFLPPAGQGDVYRAARDGARAIGIIDGYFERVPSVWHKEILWAMTEGVHVFGSASMGALRAAELADFGMRGVGAIFEQLRSQELEDDDEVAIAHGEADTGYRALSVAMVDVRATLRHAQARGVITEQSARSLEQLAKATFYAERTYEDLFARGSQAGVPADQLDALRAFLPEGRVSQKRLDALAMLAAMKEFLAGDPERNQVGYPFVYTDAWEQFIQTADRARIGGIDSGADVLQELSLSGSYPSAQRSALLRALALDEARRRGVQVTDAMLEAEIQALRQRHELDTMDDLQAWMARQELDIDGLQELLHQQVKLRWIDTMFAPDALRALPNHLRITGDYGSLLQRSRASRKALRESGLDEISLQDVSLSEEELWSWYFGHKLQRQVPGDLSAYARVHGFDSQHAMRRAALRAYCQERGQRAS